MVCRRMACGRRCHIAQHNVDLVRHALTQCRKPLFRHEVGLEQVSAGHRLHFQQVDADDGAFALAGADAFHSDLGPASGRRTEIDNGLARLQEMEFLVQLLQLERCTGTKAELLRLDHIRVVQLPAQPTLR